MLSEYTTGFYCCFFTSLEESSRNPVQETSPGSDFPVGLRSSRRVSGTEPRAGVKQRVLKFPRATANPTEPQQSPQETSRSPKSLLRHTTWGNSHPNTVFVTAPGPPRRERGLHPWQAPRSPGAARTMENYFQAATTQETTLSQDSAAPSSNLI